MSKDYLRLSRYTVKSMYGFVLFFQIGFKSIVRYDKFTLHSKPNQYSVQGDYIIFSDDFQRFELNFCEILENHKDYDELEMEDLKDPVIVLHKKYIHKLTLRNYLDHELGFRPTKQL